MKKNAIKFKEEKERLNERDIIASKAKMKICNKCFFTNHYYYSFLSDDEFNKLKNNVKCNNGKGLSFDKEENYIFCENRVDDYNLEPKRDYTIIEYIVNDSEEEIK